MPMYTGVFSADIDDGSGINARSWMVAALDGLNPLSIARTARGRRRVAAVFMVEAEGAFEAVEKLLDRLGPMVETHRAVLVRPWVQVSGVYGVFVDGAEPRLGSQATAGAAYASEARRVARDAGTATDEDEVSDLVAHDLAVGLPGMEPVAEFHADIKRTFEDLQRELNGGE